MNSPIILHSPAEVRKLKMIIELQTTTLNVVAGRLIAAEQRIAELIAQHAHRDRDTAV